MTHLKPGPRDWIGSVAPRILNLWFRTLCAESMLNKVLLNSALNVIGAGARTELKAAV